MHIDRATKLLEKLQKNYRNIENDDSVGEDFEDYYGALQEGIRALFELWCKGLR